MAVERKYIEQVLSAELEQLRAQDLERIPMVVESMGAIVRFEGEPFINFASNDYLGLGTRQITTGVASATASRLVSGHTSSHVRLEEALAKHLGLEAALAFSSGYAANIGTVAALVGRDDVVFSDRLNHASLIDGCRLSGAKTIVYDHSDTDDLSIKLRNHRALGRRAIVLTESIFSMDGDLAPLRELERLCLVHDAWLYVDEAHAFGVLGPSGRGACAEQGVRPSVLVGTLGKALGAQGAFVGGSQILVRYLWNRARSFVFSTGLSPAMAETALNNLRALILSTTAREHALTLQRRLCAGLEARASLQISYGPGLISSVVVGERSRALDLAAHLRALGFFVRAIRPPTVPVGTSRVRFVVAAHHTATQIDRLVDAIASWDTQQPTRS